MPIRVVVEFEDDDDAKRFVASVLAGGVVYENDNDVVGVYGPDNFTWIDKLKATITAVYKRPSKFCDASDGHRGKKTASGWTRGRKYGWWVCASCGKPTKKWARGDIWHFSMGYNLLPPSVSDLERGVRSTVEWTEEELGLEKPDA